MAQYDRLRNTATRLITKFGEKIRYKNVLDGEPTDGKDWDEFIKVGVTSRTVEDRFKPVVYKQFEKEVILDLEAKARDVVNIEKLVLSTFDSDRYYISDGNAFKGCTELFKFKALNEIKSFIEEKIKSSSDE